MAMAESQYSVGFVCCGGPHTRSRAPTPVRHIDPVNTAHHTPHCVCECVCTAHTEPLIYVHVRRLCTTRHIT